MRTMLLLLACCSVGIKADDVPVKELQAGGDKHKQYYLIGDTAAKPPKGGFNLLVILPGGDGSKDFHDYSKTLATEVLPKGWLVAQVVAVEWKAKQADTIVWPLEIDKPTLTYMKFSTEEFVSAVIDEVTRDHPVNSKHVFTLSWSSGGPAAYAVALSNPKVTGSFIAMSVFPQDRIGKLENAKGKPFFLYHSPEDKVTKYHFATMAKKRLETHGAKVTLVDYDGGHGWHGATDDIRTGIDWLQNNSTAPTK